MISSHFVKMTRSEHGIWPTGKISHRKRQIKLCRMFVLPICSMQIWRYCLFLPVLLWFPQDTSLLYLCQLGFFFRVFGERHKKKTVVSKKKSPRKPPTFQPSSPRLKFKEEERGQDEDSRCAHLKSMFKHLVVVPELSEALKAGPDR